MKGLYVAALVLLATTSVNGLVPSFADGQKAARSALNFLGREVAQFEADVTDLFVQQPAPQEAAATPEAQKKRDVYFRPVAPTLYCVMVLCIQSLLIFSALAVSRNADEFSGLTKSSRLTETLATAARSAVYTSMLSMLFVGCRMYILATTEGKSDPPLWVYIAQGAATAGVTLQSLLVLLLPAVTTENEKKTISQLSGCTNDVHPRLMSHIFTSSTARTTFSMLQVLSLVAIYGGAIANIVCIYTYPEQATKLSTAVKCVTGFCCIYLSAHFFLWVARTIREVRDLPNGSEEATQARRWERAGLAMTSVVRKAPMLTVLCLGAKMRAIQLNPPRGSPPVWSNMSCFALVAVLALETLAAAVVGLNGREKKSDGLAAFQARPALHFIQHLFSFLGFVLVSVLLFGIWSLSTPDGSRAPLSPAERCYFILGSMFFLTCMGHSCTAFLGEVLRRPRKALQDVFHAATEAVAYAPLLSILFIACRMRALQITRQKGSPPGWAMLCMYITTFSAGVEYACAVLRPVLLKAATQEGVMDKDGSSTYEPGENLIGAYAAASVQYVSLGCLHIGVMAVCAAVFIMTPETADANNKGAINLLQMLEMVGTLLVVVICSLLMSSAKVIGMGIKAGIESADQVFLGTDIWVGKAALSVCEGYVSIGGLVVENPPSRSGKVWKSPYLAKVDKLIIDINMQKLLRSFGRVLEIEAVVIEGVQVVLEKSAGAHSNLAEILQHLEDMGFTSNSTKPVKAASVSKDAAPEKAEKGGNDMKIELRHVSFKDIGASAILQGAPLTFQVGDLVFDDFQEKLDQNGGASVAGDIVVMIVHTLLKTIMANFSITEGASAMLQQTGQKVKEQSKKLLRSLTPPRLRAPPPAPVVTEPEPSPASDDEDVPAL